MQKVHYTTGLTFVQKILQFKMPNFYIVSIVRIMIFQISESKGLR